MTQRTEKRLEIEKSSPSFQVNHGGLLEQKRYGVSHYQQTKMMLMHWMTKYDMDAEEHHIQYVERLYSDCYKDRRQSDGRVPNRYSQLSACSQEGLCEITRNSHKYITHNIPENDQVWFITAYFTATYKSLEFSHCEERLRGIRIVYLLPE